MDWMSLFFGVSRAIAETTGAAGTTATADAAAAEISPVASLISMLLPMVLIFVVFYFFLIRPQRKKDKQVKDMLNNLKVTDRICTIGGIYGTITGIRDDTITLAVGKDADFSVFRQNPLTIAAKPEKVFVGGREIV